MNMFVLSLQIPLVYWVSKPIDRRNFFIRIMLQLFWKIRLIIAKF